jgi:hypothetical protein
MLRDRKRNIGIRERRLTFRLYNAGFPNPRNGPYCRDMQDIDMAARVKIGDIFQILTSEGICFGQVLHTHPKWKYVIGVFYDFPGQTSVNFSEYVDRRPDLTTMFLINHAVQRGYFTIVGNVPVAECNVDFPIFRETNNPGLGDGTIWWFWDGNREWRVDHPLTDEEKKYPRGPSLPSAPLLLRYIQDGYRVERDFS